MIDHKELKQRNTYGVPVKRTTDSWRFYNQRLKNWSTFVSLKSHELVPYVVEIGLLLDPINQRRAEHMLVNDKDGDFTPFVSTYDKDMTADLLRQKLAGLGLFMDEMIKISKENSALKKNVEYIELSHLSRKGHETVERF